MRRNTTKCKLLLSISQNDREKIDMCIEVNQTKIYRDIGFVIPNQEKKNVSKLANILFWFFFST